MDIHPIDFFTIFIVVFILTNIVLSKIYLTKIDFLLLITFHSSLVVSAVLYEGWIIDTKYVVAVLVMHLTFLAGMVLMHFSLPFKKIFAKSSFLTTKKRSDLVGAMLFFCVLFLIFNAVIIANFGLAILAENPELYKTQFNREGLGYISRLSSAVGIPLFALIFLTWRTCPNKYKIIPFAAIVIAALTGGKSILINLMFFWLIADIYKSKILGERIRQSYMTIVGFTLLSLGFVIFVLYLSYGSALENISDDVLPLFMGRISTAPGLGVVTYLENINYFEHVMELNPISYLWNYIIVPLFAPLRLVDYPTTLNRETAIFISGDDTYGPNLTVYGEAIAYFGVFFGCVYTFVIGCIISTMRYLAIYYAINLTPALGAVVFISLYYSQHAFSTDFLVTIGILQSAFLGILIYYVFSLLSKIIKLSIAQK